MRRCLFVLILLVMNTLLSAISIYDIQYTSDPGFDGTYPSKYESRSVSITGVVIAIDKSQSRYFITDQDNQPWTAICIIDPMSRYKTGEKISVTGKVIEHHGMTCIKSDSSQLISSSHPLPRAQELTIMELNAEECYESCLVSLSDVNLVKSAKPGYLFALKDFNHQCMLGSYLYNFEHLKRNSSSVAISYSSIKGIVCFANNQFSLNPRSSLDMNTSSVGNHSTSWGKIKSLYR